MKNKSLKLYMLFSEPIENNGNYKNKQYILVESNNLYHEQILLNYIIMDLKFPILSKVVLDNNSLIKPYFIYKEIPFDNDLIKDYSVTLLTNNDSVNQQIRIDKIFNYFKNWDF